MFVLWRYWVAVLSGMRRGDQSGWRCRIFSSRNKPGDQGTPGPSCLGDAASWRSHSHTLGHAVLCVGVGIGTVLRDDTIWPSQTLMLALVYSFACAPMIDNIPRTQAREGTDRTSAALPLLTVSSRRITAGTCYPEASSSLWARDRTGADIPGPRHQSNVAGGAVLVDGLATKLRGVAPITFAALVLFSTWALSRLAAAAGHPFLIGLNAMFVLMSLPSGGLAWAGVHYISAGA
jgi:hypothetical protein